MSCNCNQTVLPTIADDSAIHNPTAPVSLCCADPASLSSETSVGATVPSWATDAACATSDVTLLGRVGSTLARLVGSGFIQITDGKASVVASVPLALKDLWHRWWKPTPMSPPILGDPLDFTYLAIGDAQGKLHGIKGDATENSLPLWRSATSDYAQTPVSLLDKTTRGVISRADEIELTGYLPIPVEGSLDTVRPLKALNGEGIVVLTEQATVDGACDCAPGTGTASTASALAYPVPVSTEVYSLKYSTALGLHWSEDA